MNTQIKTKKETQQPNKLEILLEDFDYIKVITNKKPIIECMDIYDSIDELFDEDEINDDLREMLFTMYGYQDQDEIHIINSIFKKGFDYIYSDPCETLPEILKFLNRSLRKILSRTSSREEYEYRTDKGFYFSENLVNKGDK